jgi:aminoglycoside 6-adenylyltransferase
MSAAHWAQLEETYVGTGADENWTALFKTTMLLREVAQEVGKRLGYAYPDDMDKRCIAYLGWVRGGGTPEH